VHGTRTRTPAFAGVTFAVAVVGVYPAGRESPNGRAGQNGEHSSPLKSPHVIPAACYSDPALGGRRIPALWGRGSGRAKVYGKNFSQRVSLMFSTHLELTAQ